VTGTIFSDSEDRLTAVGLSDWQLKQKHAQSLNATVKTLVSARKQILKCND